VLVRVEKTQLLLPFPPVGEKEKGTGGHKHAW
jgi:hypothetical protein